MAKKQKTIDISTKNSKLVLGKTLKTARKQKNLSVEDLHELTKIPLNSIKNLEDEQWKKLPARAYVKGFLKSYAKHVGLNYQDLLDMYSDSIPASASKDLQKADFIHIKPTKSLETEDKDSKQESKISTALLVFILILIASLTISYFSSQNEKDNSVSPSASEIANIDVTG